MGTEANEMREVCACAMSVCVRVCTCMCAYVCVRTLTFNSVCIKEF